MIFSSHKPKLWLLIFFLFKGSKRTRCYFFFLHFSPEPYLILNPSKMPRFWNLSKYNMGVIISLFFRVSSKFTCKICSMVNIMISKLLKGFLLSLRLARWEVELTCRVRIPYYGWQIRKLEIWDTLKMPTYPDQ